MKPKVTLRKALDDPALLGGVLGGDTWHTWRASFWQPWVSRCSPTNWRPSNNSAAARHHPRTVLTNSGVVWADVAARAVRWQHLRSISPDSATTAIALSW